MLLIAGTTIALVAGNFQLLSPEADDLYQIFTKRIGRKCSQRRSEVVVGKTTLIKASLWRIGLRRVVQAEHCAARSAPTNTSDNTSLRDSSYWRALHCAQSYLCGNLPSLPTFYWAAPVCLQAQQQSEGVTSPMSRRELYSNHFIVARNQDSVLVSITLKL
ncbi:jg20752 [Pararge aegeria aegeria]|uniref:Jg20752 protein n=1 Tax=Pararge aegeria aegeria TaxID=348720 RepID=A0A8S4R2W9_9NEOP|nr:jg20752 [Pararge aegeria aegeria]